MATTHYSSSITAVKRVFTAGGSYHKQRDDVDEERGAEIPNKKHNPKLSTPNLGPLTLANPFLVRESDEKSVHEP